ncbi:Endonuclease/exonuclease/phosphatase [Xylariaceae sp. FL1019]|nr:Endonuclease/exonuclease/phosphatase [Xylariaceae sp. FL1019]
MSSAAKEITCCARNVGHRTIRVEVYMNNRAHDRRISLLCFWSPKLSRERDKSIKLVSGNMKLLFGISLVTATAQAASGSFNVLSFNVAGLPAILNNNGVPGDKTTNTETIGTKFAQYDFDLIHVQEDFHYHSHLYATDNHTYRTDTSGDVPFGSGLNTLSNLPWNAYIRKTWATCSLGSGDCLTPKGFTFMRLVLQDGVSTVDVYNLHTDAGTGSGDFKARRANVQEVADYIDAMSVGQPVLVFGDTNSRYARSGDMIQTFVTQNGLSDAWVELVLGGVAPTADSSCGNPAESATCEVLDKIFYRSGASVSLTATSFSYEAADFLQADGNILSDHNPVLASFDWATI